MEAKNAKIITTAAGQAISDKAARAPSLNRSQSRREDVVSAGLTRARLQTQRAPPPARLSQHARLLCGVVRVTRVSRAHLSGASWTCSLAWTLCSFADGHLKARLPRRNDKCTPVSGVDTSAARALRKQTSTLEQRLFTTNDVQPLDQLVLVVITRINF